MYTANGARMPYVSGAVLRKEYGISNSSARRWRNTGAIKTIETAGGHYRYLLEDVVNVRSNTKATKGQSQRRKIAYCRVSSSKQKDDLKRQEQSFRESHPEHEIIRDIGSGINFKRRGLLRMVDAILQGNVQEVVVAHKDRLCRFAFDFLEWICKRGDTNLVVQEQILRSTEQELTEDLVAIVHVFSCKLHGSRRYKKQKGEGHNTNEVEKSTHKDNTGTSTNIAVLDEDTSPDVQRSSKACEGQEG